MTGKLEANTEEKIRTSGWMEWMKRRTDMGRKSLAIDKEEKNRTEKFCNKDLNSWPTFHTAENFRKCKKLCPSVLPRFTGRGVPGGAAGYLRQREPGGGNQQLFHPAAIPPLDPVAEEANHKWALAAGSDHLFLPRAAQHHVLRLSRSSFPKVPRLCGGGRYHLRCRPLWEWVPCTDS